MLHKRGSLFLFFRCCLGLTSGGSSMALSRVMVSTSHCGFGTLSQQTEGCRLPQRSGAATVGVLRPSFGSFLRLRGCLDKQDGAFRRKNDDILKYHALSRYCRPNSDVNVSLGVFSCQDLVNVQGTQKDGRHFGFPDHPLPKKLTVAVDVDEVLGSFLSALNKFIADRYCSNHSVSEYHVYEFYKVWNCTRGEADIRVHEFFKTSYFKNGINPIPGARPVLDKISSFCNLSIVTSRQNVIKSHTLEWIENHYPGVFQEIHFGNHFALDGGSRPKSEICRSLGAEVLIDDNPRYALECAEAGIKALLFDYDNSYPWSKSDSAISHPLVTKVHNWDEVELNLSPWAVI